MMWSDVINLCNWLWKMWLKFTPHFICKEARMKEAKLHAEFARKEEYVKKLELVIAFKGLHIETVKRTRHKCYAYIVEDECPDWGVMRGWFAAENEIEAKYGVIKTYYKHNSEQ